VPASAWALAIGVDASTAAAAPVDVSALTLACIAAAGAAAVALADVVDETVASPGGCTEAAAGGDGVHSAAAVPAYASTTNTAESAHADVRRTPLASLDVSSKSCPFREYGSYPRSKSFPAPSTEGISPLKTP
jgi:hypothetical protein